MQDPLATLQSRDLFATRINRAVLALHSFASSNAQIFSRSNYAQSIRIEGHGTPRLPKEFKQRIPTQPLTLNRQGIYGIATRQQLISQKRLTSARPYG